MVIIGNNKFQDFFENKIIINNNPLLPNPVANHPDMNICIIDDTVFLPKNSPIFNEISKLKLNIITISENLNNKYPFDVPLNCKAIDDFVILNPKTVSKEILEYCNKNKKIISVNQGYAACSTLAVSKNVIITADKGIYTALKNAGLSPLLIKEGYIKINEYDYGFIGGASGFVDNTLYFFGDITLHPDYHKIKDYLAKNNIKFKYFDGKLLDIGGIIKI